MTNTELLNHLEETKKRWSIFLVKLEEKLDELTAAAVPELEELVANDEDGFETTIIRFKAGITGQLDNLHKKAYDTHEEKILDLYQDINSQINVHHQCYTPLSDFRTECYNLFSAFGEKLRKSRDIIDKASEPNYELMYKKTIDEYEQIKNKFKCTQCGSVISIPQIFTIGVHIACTSCATQNTFQPSSQAKRLPHIARNIAQGRTEQLYHKYQNEKESIDTLYSENHSLKLSIMFEKDKKVIAETQKKMSDNETKRNLAIEQTPKHYKEYLRAFYDELNKIVPDTKEHNEIRYQNELNNI